MIANVDDGGHGKLRRRTVNTHTTGRTGRRRRWVVMYMSGSVWRARGSVLCSATHLEAKFLQAIAGRPTAGSIAWTRMGQFPGPIWTGGASLQTDNWRFGKPGMPKYVKSRAVQRARILVVDPKMTPTAFPWLIEALVQELPLSIMQRGKMCRTCVEGCVDDCSDMGCVVRMCVKSSWNLRIGSKTSEFVSN